MANTQTIDTLAAQTLHNVQCMGRQLDRNIPQPELNNYLLWLEAERTKRGLNG